MIFSRLENIELEKRTSLRVGSSDFIYSHEISIGNHNIYIFNYVYNYTDHLGNIRLSYTKDPVNGQIKVMEENHYYPFGLKHAVYSGSSIQNYQLVDNMSGNEPIARPTYALKTDYQYKYNGKEFQDELGLGLYDYHARNYDPALGRWTTIDPMASKYYSHSPYSYTLNNPVYFIDPTGMMVENGDPPVEVANEGSPVQLETAVVTVNKSDLNSSNKNANFLNDVSSKSKSANSWDGAYRNMLSPENKPSYLKMQQAKREGEWFAVGVFGGSIVAIYTLPAVIGYGSVAISAEVELLSLYGSGAWKASMATTSGGVLLKTAIDMAAQGIVNNGDINPVASLTGAMVPGSSWRTAVGAGLVSEATSLTMDEIESPGSVGVKDVIGAGVKSAVAGPAGMHSGNLISTATGSSVAGEAGGAVFSNYVGSEVDNAK